MNRSIVMSGVLIMAVVATVGMSRVCTACPPVAVAQAATSDHSLALVQPVSVVQPVAAAVAVAQPALGVSYPAANVTALPLSTAQPLALAQPVLAPVGLAAQATATGGSCARASARAGACAGVRRGILPRQRAVSRVVVR